MMATLPELDNSPYSNNRPLTKFQSRASKYSGVAPTMDANQLVLPQTI